MLASYLFLGFSYFISLEVAGVVEVSVSHNSVVYFFQSPVGSYGGVSICGIEDGSVFSFVPEIIDIIESAVLTLLYVVLKAYVCMPF
ncbi:hypothetical protein C498_06715 [Haloferax volcanii DS2]|uniref:Uncharacterized protein n=1 Tax=Haloferax volcanii (strain ATCC 29605 / DSM 3757 / JCM 8879 / NBRC 14742 / NCIMB 2012 / VKM B-1768 / DS2) TaxID=309800 RepID=L9V8I1_HALVD|nr:hypothetical protein C498_06715 [Haloferax volcanii DS2]